MLLIDNKLLAHGFENTLIVNSDIAVLFSVQLNFRNKSCKSLKYLANTDTFRSRFCTSISFFLLILNNVCDNYVDMK